LGRARRGRSHSVRPVSKRIPPWCKYTSEEVEGLVAKLAKDGNPPSLVGTILRDGHGVPSVRSITNKSVLGILKESGLSPKLPEDLDNLIKNAVRLRNHFKKNKRDYHNKGILQSTEAKIRGLARHYKERGVLPPDWEYKPETSAAA